MVEWITVLIVCQLAGEAFVAFTHVPIPGPVCGMALLFAGLVWNGRVPDDLGKTADGLLSKLSLLFVPAGARGDAAFQASGGRLASAWRGPYRQHAPDHCGDGLADGSSFKKAFPDV